MELRPVQVYYRPCAAQPAPPTPVASSVAPLSAADAEDVLSSAPLETVIQHINSLDKDREATLTQALAECDQKVKRLKDELARQGRKVSDLKAGLRAVWELVPENGGRIDAWVEWCGVQAAKSSGHHGRMVEEEVMIELHAVLGQQWSPGHRCDSECVFKWYCEDLDCPSRCRGWRRSGGRKVSWMPILASRRLPQVSHLVPDDETNRTPYLLVAGRR